VKLYVSLAWVLSFSYGTLPASVPDALVFPDVVVCPEKLSCFKFVANLHDSDLIPPTRSCATMVSAHSDRYHSEAPSQCEVIKQSDEKQKPEMKSEAIVETRAHRHR
jgi:hypothetical protein